VGAAGRDAAETLRPVSFGVIPDCAEGPVPKIPPVTLNLLWILTGAFVLQWLTGGAAGAGGSPLVAWLGLWPITGEGFGSGFLPWQLVTYALLHHDFVHLFFNAFMVWMIGAMLETQWGARRYIHFILACVVAAGAVHLICTALGLFPPGPAIGISGLAYGLLLAFGLMYPNQQMMLVIPPMPIKAKYLVMILAGLSLFMGLTTKGGVAHFAHLGGMLGAWLIMQYWRGGPPFNKRRPKLRAVR
jgi:membrane associated rhomboid family serine protease